MIFGSNSLTLNGGTIILNGAVTNNGGVTVGDGHDHPQRDADGGADNQSGRVLLQCRRGDGIDRQFRQMGNTGTIVGTVSTAGSLLSNSGVIEGRRGQRLRVQQRRHRARPGDHSGTLSGNGTVSSVLGRARGFVSPGHSIGTVTVTGNATFEPGSLYVAELGAPGTSDVLLSAAR